MNLLPKSLYVRLVLMAAVGTSLSIFSLGGYIAYQQKNLALAAAHQQAYMIATSAATAVTDNLIIQNYADIEQSLKQLAIYPAVKSLQVIHANGNIVLTVTQKTDKSLRLHYGGKVAVPANQTMQSTIAADHITTWTPVTAGSLVGWVRSDLSLSNISATQRRILLDTGLIALISIFLSTLISCLLLRRPIQQIRTAADFASALPEKHQQTLLITPSSSEIKHLIQALNSAAQELCRQDNELQLLNSLIEYSADPIFIVDVADDFRMLFVNDAACYHFGLSREKLLTCRVSDLSLNPNMPSIKSRWEQIKISKHLVFETQHKTALSDHVPVQISANYLFYKDKELIAGYFTDISERKQMEDALRASEHRLQEIINTMPIAVFIKDPASHILMMNKVCEQQWGVDFKQMQGTTGSQFFAPEQLQSFLADDQKAFAQKQLFETDEQIWNAGLKETRSIHAYKKPVFNQAGEPLYLIGISVDVTETKQQQENLRLATIAAERANQAKSLFLANMSHEIRTPMNAIIGMTHLAKRNALSEKQQNYLSKIEHSAHSLLYIINQILDFSKIEAGKLELEQGIFLLSDLLANLTNIMEFKAQQKGIELIVSYHSAIKQYFIGDSVRLEQILINLVGNAIKFTEHGHVIVSVATELLSNETMLLRFSVQDSGIGMTSAQLSSLFQSFSQADASITRKYGGTGLGLAISKQLVKMMQGDIWLESQLNKGSTVNFTVILAIAEAPAQSTTSFHTHDDSDVSCLNGKKILLVEDNDINCELATELLTDLGIVVESAKNGREAVQRIFAEPFDLVLMDIQMPEMDGLTATRLIRADTRFSQLPIIAMTANAMAGDRENSLTAGMNDHLTKPIMPEKLTTLLMHWLTKQTPLKSAPVPIQAPAEKIISETSVPDYLPPFDIPAALLRVNHKAKLLRKLLLMFSHDYSDALPKLKTLIQEGQYEEAKRFAHALKSVAGSLEAAELAKAAKALEYACYENNMPTITQLIDELDKALQPALLAANSLEK